MDIYVGKGKTKTINENNFPSEKITSLIVEEGGSLTISNASDEIKLLEFDSYVSLNVKGELYISGKMIELAKFNNEPISLPVAEYNIPVIWVETEAGSNEFEMYRCINLGSLDYQFDKFAPTKDTGRVFRIENGKIVFSNDTSKAVTPKPNASIKIPNIIISTQNGKTAAGFSGNTGGLVSLRNVITDNFKMNLAGLSKVNLKGVASTYPYYLTYINELTIDEVGIANNSKYSSGLLIAYCSNIDIKNIEAQSVKNYGVVIQYMDKPNLSNVTGYVIERGYSTTGAITLDAISNATAVNLNVIGGNLNIQNSSNSSFKEIKCIDSVDLTQNTSYAQANINIENSSYIDIEDVLVPKNGAGHTAIVNAVNSNNLKVVDVSSLSKGSTYAISLQVVFNSIFARISSEEVSNIKHAINVDNRSRNNTFQNIYINNVDVLQIGGIKTLLKDVSANDVEILAGAYDTYFALLKNQTSKIAFKMFPNSNAKVVKGNPKLLYFGGLELSKDDIIEIEAPTTIKGIQFLDNPIIDSDNSNVRFFFKVKTSDFESDFLVLSKEELTAINEKIKNEYVKITLRIDASKVETSALVKSIDLPIAMEDVAYPVSFKKIYINFNKQVQFDPTAVFALMYANTYKNGKGVFLRDKDGNPIVQKVDGRASVVFEYDFEEDDTANRVPNKDFDVVAVLTTNSLIEPVEIYQTMTKDDVFAIGFNPKLDKAYEVAQEILKG